ncbi:tail length tape-measure protein [Xanthomonas phage vB_Xar_IVIA-DoCa10]|uniref:Tail length tape-measure protein n=1 Tax=Xanthomonas phage vB_Xar_IVIA-DoCa10 TaxID=2975529 RepID=A0A9X9JND0_9CAUD|nr:tail length tape-measure protein [Xanthomonas phage vB_Xar_IVIA-DoCa10]UYA99016.1 tail length tape-measure protein [Xanthomonas phage vB_Xar_IVIA-DoCa10]
MATDVASLAIKIESLQVQQADSRLKGLASSGGTAEKATSGLMGAFTKLLGPLAAAVSVMGTLNKLMDVQRQFDVLNAGLITATGSSEKAAIAFDALREFAQNTPYDLNQAVEGFTKLVNLGLDPSEKALMSYGNTASAMGKDLNQMIEAVADAATGEFERLKEFGIKAKQNGDQVSLTFRGVTTSIGNNAAEIEKYLTDLGENEFAGAMETRMDSLDGAVANLGDTWDQLWLTISQSGIGDAIEASVRTATDALQELTDMIASGQMEALLKSQTVQWEVWGKDIEESIDIVTQFIKDNFGEWEDEGQSVVDFLIDAFKQLPTNLRAMVQILTVEFASGFDRIIAGAEFWRDTMKAIFSDTTIADAGRKWVAEQQRISQVRLDSISDIMDERDATLKASEDQLAAAKKLREEYDAAQEAKKKANAGTDRLAQFRIGADKPKTASSGVDKDAARAQKQREQEFQRVKDALQTEEEAIRSSYEKRKAIIEANTKVGTEERTKLMGRLDAERDNELKKLGAYGNSELEQLRQSLLKQEDAIKESYDRRMEMIRANTEEGSKARAELEAQVLRDRDKALADTERQRQSERDSLYNSLLTEEEALKQSYERKKQLILESESVTELERQDLLRRLQKQFQDEQAQMENQRIQTQLQGAAAMFDGLAGLAKGYAGEQSKAYKVLFAVSKAFSVAQAAMSISTGLAKAQELGFPANLAEMARVAATGASIISQINGAQFAGAYDQGGQIPAGKVGIVGEYGPELVKGPASVRGRELSSRSYPDGGGGQQASAAPPVVNVRNINVLDPNLVGDYLGTDEGEKLIMNVVNRNKSSLGY